MKFEIYKFKTVTSTNDVAADLIKNKNKKYGCIYANKQTKGRGTQGKGWISEEGNLFGSIFFPLEKQYPPFNEFSIINPVIISDVIKKFCINKKLSFKWPNDVYVEGKKICGILQEVITLNEKKFLIIGIGINITSSPKIENNYKTTNIFTETSNKPTTKEVIDHLILTYENFFYNLSSYRFLAFKIKAELMATK